MLTLANFRKNLLLLVVMLYLVLNYGFMQVRICGIPIGELMLLFSLITINYDRLLPRISEITLLIPFILWWALGLARILTALPKYGFWALMDANHVIESLFLIIGFALAACPQTLER